MITDDIVCNEMSQGLSQVNLDGRIDDGLRDESSEGEKILLQPNTVLEKHLVSTLVRYYYIHCNGALGAG